MVVRVMERGESDCTGSEGERRCAWLCRGHFQCKIHPSSSWIQHIVDFDFH